MHGQIGSDIDSAHTADFTYNTTDFTKIMIILSCNLTLASTGRLSTVSSVSITCCKL